MDDAIKFAPLSQYAHSHHQHSPIIPQKQNLFIALKEQVMGSSKGRILLIRCVNHVRTEVSMSQQHDDRELRHKQSIYIKCYAFNLRPQFKLIINISNQQTLQPMIQNSKNYPFSQFQKENLSEMEQNDQKVNYEFKIKGKLSNPIKFSCQKRPYNENIMVSQCQLITNYHESQQHSQTFGTDQKLREDDINELQSTPQCSDCIDIDSIMNPTSNHKLIAQSGNNSIEADSKGVTLDAPKEVSVKQYKERDETKNIPKNFIKAVSSFILENPALIKKMFARKRSQLECCELSNFMEFVRSQRKNKTYTIGRLKQIWMDECYGKIMRIIYAYFLRKRTPHYIYSSKIENKCSHIKYRHKLIDSLRNPSGFNNFK